MRTYQRWFDRRQHAIGAKLNISGRRALLLALKRWEYLP